MKPSEPGALTALTVLSNYSKTFSPTKTCRCQKVNLLRKNSKQDGREIMPSRLLVQSLLAAC